MSNWRPQNERELITFLGYLLSGLYVIAIVAMLILAKTT